LKNATKKAPAVKAAPAKKAPAKTTLSPKSKAAVASAKKHGAAEVQTLDGTINLAKSTASAAEPAPAPAPKARRLTPKEKREAIARGESSRVTPGAKVDMWRIRRSQRIGVDGYLLQGGFSEATAKGERFTVGKETLYTDLAAAKTALAEARGAQ
jgi:hypothetical protein